MFRGWIPSWRGSSPVLGAIAWTLFGLTVLFFVPALALAATQSFYEFGFANLVTGWSFVAFGAVGALVASRRPKNMIGWLLSAGAVLVAGGLLNIEYAIRSLMAENGPWPGKGLAAWLGLVLTLLGTTLLLPATVLHFPDGQLPTPNWRWVRRALVAGMATVLAISAFAPGPLSFGRLTVVGNTRNPVALEIPLLQDLQPIVFPLIATVVVVAFATPYLRLRRAQGAERQQLKWFVYASVLMAASVVAAAISGLVRPGQQAADLLGNPMSGVGFMALPVAIGTAVLKYRLYDIDMVINRTLVYGTVSVLLGALYAGGVVVLSRLFFFSVGNSLAVAASTLAAAALFSPLRRVIQRFVDRKFYRSRYDASQVVQDFSARLRENVDVDRLESDLMGVVQRALQPACIGMWVKRSGEANSD